MSDPTEPSNVFSFEQARVARVQPLAGLQNELSSQIMSVYDAVERTSLEKNMVFKRFIGHQAVGWSLDLSPQRGTRSFGRKAVYLKGLILAPVGLRTFSSRHHLEGGEAFVEAFEAIDQDDEVALEAYLLEAAEDLPKPRLPLFNADSEERIVYAKFALSAFAERHGLDI